MEFKLIIKKLNNTLTQEESHMFSDWYSASANHRLYFERVAENYTKDIDMVDAEHAWNSLSAKLFKKPKKTRYWQYAIAAVVVLLLGIPFLLNNVKSTSQPNLQIAQKVIVPGTDKATLTLEDGTEIALEVGTQFQGKSMVSNGKEIAYKTDGKKSTTTVYNYLTIPTGGQFFLKLADGTQVWLNSESQLKYPVQFIEGETRQVELVYGEAYFDVSPSTEHKGALFKVLTNQQEVEVLGTEFNIKAYPEDHHIFTTLVEGQVAVSNPKGSAETVLSPNQQSIIKTNQSGIEVVHSNVYNEISWKEGVFSFDNMSLKQIMKVLSRWYDIDVVFMDSNIENITFNGVLRKNQNIEDILKPIQSINTIAYEIKDRTVIFK